MQNILARKLRVFRAERGLTLREAEDVTGVDKDTLSKLERGLRRPFDVTLGKLAKGYGVDVEDLLEEPVLAGKAEAPAAVAGPAVTPSVGDEPEEGLPPQKLLHNELDRSILLRYKNGELSLDEAMTLLHTQQHGVVPAGNGE